VKTIVQIVPNCITTHAGNCKNRSGTADEPVDYQQRSGLKPMARSELYLIA